MAKPSNFELKLLRYLWQRERLSAREIHQASQVETGWSYSTTRKALDRMVAKGLLRIEQIHGLKTFAAAHSKLQTMAGLIKDFARNILDTDEPLPAAAFAHSKFIEPEEIEALGVLLEELDQDDGSNVK